MRWDRWSAAQLNLNAYFQPDISLLAQRPVPSLKVDGDRVSVRSSRGLKLWGAGRDGLPWVFEELKAPQTDLSLSIEALRKQIGTTEPFEITAFDADGRRSTVKIPASKSEE
jgi:hypothetical protein